VSGNRDHSAVDAIRVGRSLRALRIRRGLRQIDVAGRAGISPSQCSRIERGHLGNLPIRHSHAVCAVLGADLDLRVRWHGEGLDRLLDAAHADLVDRVTRLLIDLDWLPAIEVSFNEFGERGVVDILAWHADARALLVIEIKSVVPDAQSMVAALDRKARLAPAIGRQRGWSPLVLGTLLVIADNSTSRQRVDALKDLFGAAYPDRGVAARRWLKSPAHRLNGLLFLHNSPPGRARRRAAGRERVRLPRNGPNRSQLPPGGR
jgi:transcriptional regulator with XRE-family HTH domain